MIQSVADPEQIRTLLPAVLRRAGGVPFFLVSFVEDLPAAEPGTAHLTLSWTVREVIGQRVLVLPESAQELLALAAVAGRVIQSSLLTGVSGRSEDEVLTALEAAATARLVAEDDQGQYRFAHDLIRETIEDDLSAQRRRLLHRRIAQTLERERASAETLAFHFALGDDEEKTIAYLELAGDEAQQRVAFTTAAEFFQQAIDRLQSAQRPQDTPTIREKLGVALYRIGRYDDAITALEAALEGCRATGEEAAIHRLSGRLADAHFRRGTSDEHLEQMVSPTDGGELMPAHPPARQTRRRRRPPPRRLDQRDSRARGLGNDPSPPGQPRPRPHRVPRGAPTRPRDPLPLRRSADPAGLRPIRPRPRKPDLSPNEAMPGIRALRTPGSATRDSKTPRDDHPPTQALSHPTRRDRPATSPTKPSPRSLRAYPA